jgi:hypothetical protein
MRNVLTVLSVILLLGLSQVAADTGSPIILVSDNHADCAVAEAVAEENEATIVKTTWGEFEQSVLDTIQEAEPAEVIVIGGPMAVVGEYVTGLEEAGITVDRLWGQTRQQTSLAVFNRFRSRYNWSAAVGDGAQPYRMAGRFPVWFYDNESEIDGFLMQHRAMVMNYGMTRRFAGRYGTPMMDVAPAQVQNFGEQIRDRIHMQYSNGTWVRQRMGMGPGKAGRMGMGGY